MKTLLRTSSRDQFAGWGVCDHSAICLTCRHQHLIPKSEQITAQPWLDWLHKHKGHVTFIVPSSELDSVAELPLRHNADVRESYAASAAYTITLTGLATDTNLLAGRSSASVSNASNKYLDELVAGQVMTGTTPTTAKQIEVHAVGALNDTPLWPDVFDGTDSAKTIGSVADGASIKPNICAQVALLQNNVATSNVGYPFKPTGIRQLFGDGLPPAHHLFVTHNTAVNLNATAANHFLYHTPVYATVI